MPYSYELYYPMIVPFGDTFLVVGGLDGDAWAGSKTIYEYQPDTSNWIKRKEELAKGKVYSAVFGFEC